MPGSSSPNVTYLKEIWHAIQTQDITGKDALLALTQRPLTTPDTPGGPPPIPFLIGRPRSAGRSAPRRRPPAPRRTADPAARLTGQAESTHSSEPSAKNWCFHTGSRALTLSTSRAHVSNAAARWSAATAATRAASPICSVPMRWLTAMARTPLTVGRDLGGHVRQSLLRRGVRGVLQPRHGASVVVIANHAGESHDGSGRFVRHQRLVLGQLDRLVGQFGAQNDGGHRVWSLPLS